MDQKVQDDLFRLLRDKVAQEVGAFEADQGLACQVLEKEDRPLVQDRCCTREAQLMQRK